MKNVKGEEEINVCQFSEATKLRLEHKALDEKIREVLVEIQLERFDAAQIAWQQMLEKDCELEANFYEGAPIYMAIHAQCLQKHYRDRIKTLTNYLCPEYSFVNGCAAP